MSHYIITLYNQRQKLKRALHQNSTPETMKQYKHITNVLKDTIEA